MDEQSHPVALSIDDPERTLNRLTTFFPIIVAIPILVVISTVSGKGGPFTTDAGRGGAVIAGAGGLLFLGPLLMVVLRERYPPFRLTP